MTKKIGLIAGGGDLPVFIAREAVKNGFQVFVAALEGFTLPEIKNHSAACEFFKLGKIDAPISFLKKNGVSSCIMVGNIAHVNIFSDIRPDLRGANLLMRLKDKSPTGIFSAIAGELAKDGIELANSAMFLKDSLARQEVIAGGKISPKRYEDVKYGFETAKKIAGMDIGLSVVVKDRAVIAVEAIEGTDECVKRAGEILKKKNPGNASFTLVKVARPSQDMRFDLPVIGSKTVESVAAAGGDLIAVEAKKTLIVDLENTVKLASEKKITIVGIK